MLHFDLEREFSKLIINVCILKYTGYGEKLEFVVGSGPGHIHHVLCEACLELATTGYKLLQWP